MDVFEALLTLIVALSLLTLLRLITYMPGSWTHIQYVLAEDMWRVLYLRHGLEAFYPTNATELEEDLERMYELTSFCIQYSTPTFTYESEDCPQKGKNIITVKEVFSLGEVSLSIGK